MADVDGPWADDAWGRNACVSRAGKGLISDGCGFFLLPACLRNCPPKGFLSLFQEGQYQRTSGRHQGESVRDRLFIPRNMGPGERCPLLLWLHGYLDALPDNKRNVKWLEHVIDDYAHAEKYRFFILAVQCPPAERVWFRQPGPANPSANQPDDMLTVTYQIMRKVMQEQPIDEDRVYVSGLLMGGTACWEIAMRYPGQFASAVPTTSSAPTTCRAWTSWSTSRFGRFTTSTIPASIPTRSGRWWRR